jgi:hypothetical protein
MFILNEIWALDKMCVLVGTLLGENTLLTRSTATGSNCKQHFVAG